MSEHFTLASWNLYQGLHRTSKRGAWVQNLPIERHIADLDADVLVLPEMWRWRKPRAAWAEELADSLGYELHQWVADRPSRSNEIVPWRMVIMTRIAARRLDDHVLPELGGFGQRAIVRVELEESGLCIAGVHQYGIHLVKRRRIGDWLRERAELREVAETVDVLTGDMNIWGPVMRRDAQPLRQAIKGRTFPAHRPHSQIDHLFVSDRVEVIRSQVFPDMGSDHLAIGATLGIPRSE